MKKTFGLMLIAIAGLLIPCHAQTMATEQTRWAAEAANVKIVRDDWGIAHVYGKTDADAVFGMIYAQAEDDFHRVETNYLNAMGRLAEAEGEGKIYQDLRMKMFIDPEDLKKEYAASPEWLRKLMDAFADGVNFYLAKHPEVKPRVIQHFEPWMALSFTEGSIGGDIERVELKKLEAFYGRHDQTTASLPAREVEPGGSNGIAIAPSNSRNHHALLLINPHTSFFFRSELQMASGEGLDAYGAVTWGQFFIYQGFNARAGWMHTSSGVDAVDEYLETVHSKNGNYSYHYGDGERPIVEKQIIVPYKTAQGMAEKKFTVYYTHHGPVIREQDGKWVTIRLMQEPIKALMQSYLRTKAKDYKQYLQTMELKANSSNNTIYADADGHIAYFHGNYIPRRDTRFDFTKPVDGSDPATDWKGLMTVEESPHLLDPRSGYLFNVNDSPWNGAGESSLHRKDYPAYVETGKESARGVHAMQLLQGKKDFTLDGLMTAAYDSYLPWFIQPLPALVQAWDQLPADVGNQGGAGGSNRGPAQMGYALGRGFSGHVPGHLLGPGNCEGGPHRCLRGTVFRAGGAGRCGSESPGYGVCQADCGLRHVADAVGADQPVSTANRRHRAALRRCAAEHPGGVHGFELGLAGRVRRAAVHRKGNRPRHRDQEMVRHRRQ